jgi:pyrroline-5-carboxylate reductase
MKPEIKAIDELKKQLPIGFIGGGKMALALAGGFIKKSLIHANQIVFYDHNQFASNQFLEYVPGSQLLETTAQVVKNSNIIFLAVKPQNISEVAESLIGKNKENKLFISILAGVTLTSLCDLLQTKRIIRVMPNTPCLIGEGASAFSLGSESTLTDGKIVEMLMEAVGIAYQVNEKDLDAVTALSGSGPAYVYTFIEALTAGGVLKGLTKEVAQALALQTVIGSALMVKQTGLHPAVLKDQVTSPGGTTATALQALERGGFRSTIVDAVVAAVDKSQEMGR